jgi:hypothetical protein
MLLLFGKSKSKTKKPIDYNFFVIIYNMHVDKEYEERMEKVL